MPLDGMVVPSSESVELDNHVGILVLSVQYPDGSLLYVQLYADCSGNAIIWRQYGFQYLDGSGRVRFRYDNAPHHDLPNFPHHLHLATGEILPEGPPSLHDVARAIRWHLEHPGDAWRPELTR